MSVHSDHNGLFEEFRRRLRALASTPLDATAYWRRRCEHLTVDSNAGSQFEFLRWPSLIEISPDEGSSTVYRESYLELKRDIMWQQKWFRLTRDLKIGHPKDFSQDLGTSPILVQHVYHLYLYGRLTNRSLTDCDAIFEFGGGYGSFCRLLFNAGFTGLYLIYDLPHMSELQRLFLKSTGIDELPVDEATPNATSIGETNAFCLFNSMNAVRGLLQRCKTERTKVGFVATWSLSEAPMSARCKTFPGLHEELSNYLITYEPLWQGINNDEYFSEFCKQRDDLSWTRFEIPGSIYLIS